MTAIDIPRNVATTARATAPLIHIGYHKTGTTFLQKRVFGSPESGFACPWGQQPPEVVQRFILCNAFSFDPGAARAPFDRGLQEAARGGRVPVMSHEQLSGHPIGGTYETKEIADRLHATFPEARILIGIREQKAMILSFYRQAIRKGHAMSLSELIGTGQEPAGWAPRLRLEHLAFHHAVSYYQGLFGPERVLVLPMELLKQDQAEYVARIARFTGLQAPDLEVRKPENVGWLGFALAVRRRLNLLVPRRQLGGPYCRRWYIAWKITDLVNAAAPRKLHQAFDDRLRAQIAQRVGDFYRDSNRELEHRAGLDLGGFGYDVGA